MLLELNDLVARWCLPWFVDANQGWVCPFDERGFLSSSSSRYGKGCLLFARCAVAGGKI